MARGIVLQPAVCVAVDGSRVLKEAQSWFGTLLPWLEAQSWLWTPLAWLGAQSWLWTPFAWLEAQSCLWTLLAWLRSFAAVSCVSSGSWSQSIAGCGICRGLSLLSGSWSPRFWFEALFIGFVRGAESVEVFFSGFVRGEESTEVFFIGIAAFSIVELASL